MKATLLKLFAVIGVLALAVIVVGSVNTTSADVLAQGKPPTVVLPTRQATKPPTPTATATKPGVVPQIAATPVAPLKATPTRTATRVGVKLIGPRGISGQGLTGIQIQNITNSPASVSVELWNQNGAAAISIATNDTINPLAAKNYWMGNYPAVPSAAYAAVIQSTQQVAAIVRTDWSTSGGAAIYGSIPPANSIVIPLILQNFAGQTSQFTIQNTDTANDATDVTITLYGRGSSTPQLTLTNQTITKGTSRTWDLGNTSVWGTLPNTGLDMGATGFVGSIVITSSKPLVVQSFIDLAGSRGVGGFSGVPTSAAATTLYCPLIRANYYGDTGISIVNPNASSVSGTITFRADAGSPNQGGPWTQNFTIPANSSFVAFQGPGGNSRAAPTNLPGGSQTTSNPTPTNDGFYGVATITASGNVLAVVNDTKFGSGWSVQSQSSYNCMTSADAGTKFALPLIRRYHLSNLRLTTGIQIQNTSNSPVTVQLDLTNWDGTSQSASNPPALIIPPYGSGNYWNGNLTGLPTVPPSAGGFGWYGSAILTATGGNVVVIVSDEGFGSTAVDSANYNGIKIQ